MGAEKYSDILHLPHPVSETRPHMSAHARAAQFSPFAALTGYEASLDEVDRTVEKRAELSEEQKVVIGEKLSRLAEGADTPVTLTYFVPDEKKDGGRYEVFTGTGVKLFPETQTLRLPDGTKVRFEDIYSIIGNGS